MKHNFISFTFNTSLLKFQFSRETKFFVLAVCKGLPDWGPKKVTKDWNSNEARSLEKRVSIQTKSSSLNDLKKQY